MEDGNDQDVHDRILYFGWRWSERDALDVTTATKKDDAEVDLAFWAVGGTSDEWHNAREIMRKYLHGRWQKALVAEAVQWLKSKGGEGLVYKRNKAASRDCLVRCIESTWWNWESGSRLLFWRWPQQWQVEARDGARGFHLGYPRPQLHFPNVPIHEEWIIQKDKEKLEKLLRRGYIAKGPCKTTVPRFPVPKGSDDIRVVWDLAKNGLNEKMYTPTFFLATLPTYLRRIEAGMYGGNFDVGEQFHNFMLHESEQVYCGVEIPKDLVVKMASEGVEAERFMRWQRLVFGWQSSPYQALRMFSRALEVAKGTRNENNSAFAWEKIQLNLPGSAEYDPSRPRVIKLTANGSLACDIVTFYDDGRVFGPTEVEATRALRQITARIQALGNQDAPRKRRPVSQRPGAWAGGVVFTDQHLLRKFVSQEKWDKAKEFLDWVESSIKSNEGQLERGRFQSGKGFLVYMSLTYEFLQPYLKGFHLSDDAWRKNRDSEGWKVKKPDDIIAYDIGDDDDDLLFNFKYEEGLAAPKLTKQYPKYEKPPPAIVPVPRLIDDVIAMQRFFKPAYPIQVIERPVAKSFFVVYGAGDASGEGFGSLIQPLGMQPLVRNGFWCTEESEESLIGASCEIY